MRSIETFNSLHLGKEGSVASKQVERELDNSESFCETAPLSSLPLVDDEIRALPSGARMDLVLSSQQAPTPSAQDMRTDAIMRSIGTLQMITVISIDGETVLHQNELSLSLLLGNAASNLVTNIFSLEPAAHRSMMEAIKSSRPWKRVIQVPLSLSILSREECKFGTLTFPSGPRAFLPGGLQRQKKQVMDDKLRIQSVIKPDAPTDVIKPPSTSHPPNLPTFLDREASTEADAATLTISSGTPSRWNHVQADKDENMGLSIQPPQRTLSLLKVAIASRSGGGISSASSNIQNNVLSPGKILGLAGGSEEGPSSYQLRKSRSGMEALPSSGSQARRANSMAGRANSMEDDELLDSLMSKSESISAFRKKESRLRLDMAFAAIDEDLELSCSDEDDAKKAEEAAVAAPDAVLMESPTSLKEKEEISCCFHEITASAFIDPVTKRPAILLIQTDVTSKVVMEDLLMGMSEGQLKMLGGIFPRHVIEFMSFTDEKQRLETIGGLARDHPHATILFMDIVGGCFCLRSVLTRSL